MTQKTGAFSLTGDMTAARRRHTATLLADAKVLIAGGTGADSAELYDPSTGAFTVTGKMVIPHVSHTATLLHDGRVLISLRSLDRNVRRHRRLCAAKYL
jgi:hypothetical protein